MRPPKVRTLTLRNVPDFAPAAGSLSSAESLRQTALRDHAVLGTPPEKRFDRVVAMAAAYFKAPIALISLVDNDRQWFKSCIGLQVCETPRSSAFCDHAIRLDPHSIMVVEDALTDERFCNNPLVSGAPFIRFYAGAVLTTADGYNLGSLCVIDTMPRPPLSDVDLQYLRSLADMVIDQLDLSRSRNLLDEQRRLLKSAETMSGVGHWHFDLVTQQIRWSDEVFKIFGLPVTNYAPSFEQIQTLYHEDDRATLAQLVARAAETGEGYEFQLRIKRADGSIRHTIAKAECALDYQGNTTSIFGVFQDITPEYLAAASLAASERHYRLLADHVSDVVLRTDHKGYVTYASPSCLDMSGYLPDELVGQYCGEFIHQEDAAAVYAAHIALMTRAQSDVTVDYRLRRKSGGWTWLESHMKPWTIPGDESGGVISAIRDITARKQLETELVAARDSAEGAARAKASFLANMSHEIRTPMNGVLGFTDLVLMSELKPDQRRHVELIAESGRSMMHLLNDILDVSKIESGKMCVAPEPLDLRDTLRGCADLMMPVAQTKGVNLSTIIDPAVPSHVLGDPLRVRQILLNLIGNAAKFTSAGSITVAAAMDGDLIRFEVIDTGIGIPAERLDAIFDQFSQANESTAQRYGGTGLGLTISSKLAHLMGGSISVSSVLGTGTTFTVLLPLKAATGVSVQGKRDVASSSSKAFAHKPRVLIAEDHDINQELIVALARQAGMDPALACDGAEAIAMVEEAARLGQPFKMVLMDIRMPNVDGLEATRWLRASGHSPEVLPIVALTANAYAEDLQACAEAGMQAHLAKPIRINDLTAVFRKFIGRDDRVQTSKPLASPNLHDRFLSRKLDTARTLDELGALELPSDEKLAEALDLLHKLAGVAGMFGDAALGDRARQLEEKLRVCAVDERGAIARDAGDRFREAA